MPRKKRAEHLPRPARSPFVLFAAEKRKLLREMNPEMSFIDIANQLGAMWRTLSPDSKQRYSEDALIDRIRFESERREYESKPYAKELNSNRRRKKREPGLPKMPSTAYVFFCSEFRDEAMRQHPKLSFCDFGRLAGLKWGLLTPEERSVYENRAKQDQHRYNIEMESYKKKQDEIQRNLAQTNSVAGQMPVAILNTNIDHSDYPHRIMEQRHDTEEHRHAIQQDAIVSATDESENEAPLDFRPNAIRMGPIEPTTSEQLNSDAIGSFSHFLAATTTPQQGHLSMLNPNYHVNLPNQYEFNPLHTLNRTSRTIAPSQAHLVSFPRPPTYHISDPSSSIRYYPHMPSSRFVESDLESLAHGDELAHNSVYDLGDNGHLSLERTQQHMQVQHLSQTHPVDNANIRYMPMGNSYSSCDANHNSNGMQHYTTKTDDKLASNHNATIKK